MESIKYNEYLNETLYKNQLPSGVTCYLIAKKGYVEKQAVVAVNYGSIDNHFTWDGRSYDQPEGIAHFLEHKLFEDECHSIFDEFNKRGAAVNAFTNQTNTAYYFNCIDNFEDNFRLLLDFVQKPFFTDENVEKEKDIITQEINMYRDNPYWRAYYNMQSLMYHANSPLSKDIAGSVSSIRQITKDHLYECYNAFYFPKNMVVICAGDLEPSRIYEMVEEKIKSVENREIDRHYGSFDEKISGNFIEEKMSLSMPMCILGFKDEALGDAGHRMAVSRILLEILAGESSPLYETLYLEGIIDSSFSSEYICGNFFGASIFSGSSPTPQILRDRLLAQIHKTRCRNLSRERFERIKKKQEGRFIRFFNVIDAISTYQVDLFSKGLDLFDFMQCYQDITYEAAAERLNSHLREDNFIFSVVRP